MGLKKKKFKKGWELDVNKACMDGAWSAAATVAIPRAGSTAGMKGAELHGSRCSSTEPLEWKITFVTSNASWKSQISCGDPSLAAPHCCLLLV